MKLRLNVNISFGDREYFWAQTPFFLQCINSKGKKLKGGKCAEKVNTEYRHMQADLFNLYPAIGAVNALRSNYNFTMLPVLSSDFGSCAMKIENSKAEPPKAARGCIARTYLYMEGAYKRYSMSKL